MNAAKVKRWFDQHPEHVCRAQPTPYSGPPPPIVPERRVKVGARQSLKVAIIVWTCLCAGYAGLTAILIGWDELRGMGGLRSANEITSAGTMIGYCLGLATMFAGWCMGAIPLALFWVLAKPDRKEGDK